MDVFVFALRLYAATLGLVFAFFAALLVGELRRWARAQDHLRRSARSVVTEAERIVYEAGDRK